MMLPRAFLDMTEARDPYAKPNTLFGGASATDALHEAHGAVTILLIDDDDDVRMMMAGNLEDSGYEVLEAANGEDGLSMVERVRPDIVLVDIRMPGMDGLECVRRIGEMAPLTPTIVVSGTGSVEHVAQALRSGAWDYLVKPVRDSSLVEHAITKSLERVALLKLKEAYNKDLERQVQQRTSQLYSEIEEKERAQQQLEYEVHHDSLTRLGNRRLCLKTIRSMLREKDVGRRFGMLLFDLDRFKAINEAYGFVFGDSLLMNVASRLSGAVGGEGVACRIGIDEFTVIFPISPPKGDGDRVENQAREYAVELLQTLQKSYCITDVELDLTVCMGVMPCGELSENPDQALNKAALAHREAKRSGPGSLVVYDDALLSNSVRRIAIDRELRKAITNNEFSMVFQPIIRAGDNHAMGFEALLRWESPEFGWVSPGEFIPVAEENGFISTIGDWVLEHTCRFWARSGMADRGMRLAVNVSGRQFGQQAFPRKVGAILDLTGMDPALLELEITETALMRHADEAETKLERLAALGVRVAIDDFGTGYSSLSYLRRFAADSLKIDMSFVHAMASDDRAYELVKAMINLGHTFNMNVVAEGIETEGQRSMLYAMGCDAFQGYHFSKPLAPEAVGTF